MPEWLDETEAFMSVELNISEKYALPPKQYSLREFSYNPLFCNTEMAIINAFHRKRHKGHKKTKELMKYKIFREGCKTKKKKVWEMCKNYYSRRYTFKYWPIENHFASLVISAHRKSNGTTAPIFRSA